jgi:hypothetical protein
VIHDREPDLTVSVDVRRPADVVWAAVADPRRITDWSPEASAVRGADVASGPLPVGTEFGGANRHGIFRWATRCVVVESTPGAAFAFDVTYLGLAVARWRYAIRATATGCHVDEQWWDDRGRAMRWIGTVGTGVADRRSHNHATMRATLDAMRDDLERTDS